jgi:hypothetical protein
MHETLNPLVPAKAGTQFLTLDSRWSLYAGAPKARPEYGNDRSVRL